MKAELLSHTSSDGLRDSIPEERIDKVDLLPHLSFTFAIEGISRACSHQLVRHRVASFSQQSQRHIPVRRLKERVVTPPTIEERAKDLFFSLIEASSEAYQRLVEAEIPIEDARFVLPNAAETSLLMTMEGLALMRFFGLRCCERAQWEIKAVADEMLRQVRMVEPRQFEKAGPYCFQLGNCPEGCFTCGKINEVSERYRRL